jgi:hypothetical protein
MAFYCRMNRVDEICRDQVLTILEESESVNFGCSRGGSQKLVQRKITGSHFTRNPDAILTLKRALLNILIGKHKHPI